MIMLVSPQYPKFGSHCRRGAVGAEDVYAWGKTVPAASVEAELTARTAVRARAPRAAVRLHETGRIEIDVT